MIIEFFWRWGLHKRLYTHRTLDLKQLDLKTKAPICGAFVEPSHGLEPARIWL